MTLEAAAAHLAVNLSTALAIYAVARGWVAIRRCKQRHAGGPWKHDGVG
jgi:hypothetical protein